MDNMSLNILNDKFDLYYNTAIEEKNKGNIAVSKRNFLLAAETLLKIAKESSGELKKARVARAKRIIEIADGLKVPAETHTNGGSDGQAEAEDPDAKQWQAAEIPNIRFSDIAGLSDVKQAITMRMINPLKYPEKYAAFGKKTGGGVLLYGPPGTGKTMIAKAIACEVGATFYAVKGSDIVSKWVGESEKNISSLFETARNDKLAIIFIDEMDSLIGTRGVDTHNDKRVNEFLQQIDGFVGRNPNLLLLGATNRPWDIDGAAVRSGRFSQKIYVPLPDEPAREFLLRKHFRNTPGAESLDYARFAALSQGYSGADIEELCDRAKDRPLTLSLTQDHLCDITDADVITALSMVKPTVSAVEVLRFEKYAGISHKPAEPVSPEVPTVPEVPTKAETPTKPTEPTAPVKSIVKFDINALDDYGVPDAQSYVDYSKTLEETLASFGIAAKVVNIVSGFAVTRYEMTIDSGVNLSKVSALSSNIDMAVGANVLLHTPVIGKNVVGVDIPNKHRAIFGLKAALKGFDTSDGVKIPIGVDVDGNMHFADVSNLTHLLIGGSTGSGKSVYLNSLIISLLQYPRERVQLALIDPKWVELSIYSEIDNLYGGKVINLLDDAIEVLQSLCQLMETRYALFQSNCVRNIDEYNTLKPDSIIPKIIVIIDEFADLKYVRSDDKFETAVLRLVQKSRAAGIHLIMATQRPSVDVISGAIKSNIPSRMAFFLPSSVDSKVIINRSGAECLLGNGDLLYSTASRPQCERLQAPFVSIDEIRRILGK